jgi:cytochrome c oxidase assembly factor CtaG
MSLESIATGWNLDGSLALAFTLLTAAIGALYLAAAAIGSRRDRRARRWPALRTGFFLAGLAVVLFAVDSGIGAEADQRLSAHMTEHMLIWLVAAPLLAAAAPLRLSLFALGGTGRRRLARWLRSRPVTALTGPLGSAALFSTVVVGTHIPAVYELTLENEPAHIGEHALYLLTAVLIWAPLLRADPLPHRPGPRARAACMLACMVPMALVSAWLLLEAAPVYQPYAEALGSAGALHDQRLAGLIMLLAGVPAFALALAAPNLGALPRREPAAAPRRRVLA